MSTCAFDFQSQGHGVGSSALTVPTRFAWRWVKEAPGVMPLYSVWERLLKQSPSWRQRSSRMQRGIIVWLWQWWTDGVWTPPPSHTLRNIPTKHLDADCLAVPCSRKCQLCRYVCLLGQSQSLVVCPTTPDRAVPTSCVSFWFAGFCHTISLLGHVEQVTLSLSNSSWINFFLPLKGNFFSSKCI